MGQQWPAAVSGELNTTVSAQALLKEVTLTIITPAIVWPQAKQQEETQPHPSTENWLKDLLRGENFAKSKHPLPTT